MVQGWSPGASGEDDYKAINLGQLKTVAKPFYDVLIQMGYATGYPWTGAGADDYSVANIGQIKNIFSFDVGLDTAADGLPDWWELAYFGQTGVQSTNNAPNGSGLTFLQCYQREINPQQTEAPQQAEPFSISVNATGPYQAPANPLIVASVTHPSTTTILSVTFYRGGTPLGTVSQVPYEYVLSNLQAGSYTITAVVTEQDNTTLALTTVSATTQFGVTEDTFYTRGTSLDPVYDSSIIAVDFEHGVYLDGYHNNTGDPHYPYDNFSGLYSSSQYPWFLRTQQTPNETNELWQQLTSITSGVPAYTPFNAAPTTVNTSGTGTLTVGATPPLVAFGNQNGLGTGSALFTNQSYNLGVAAGGQLVFSPITITSISSASPSVYTVASVTGLHVGQMIVISGATGNTSVNGTYLISSISGSTLNLTDPLGNPANGVTGYATSSGTINNADIKVEVYLASTFTSSGTLVNNVAPVYTQGFTLPRPSNTSAWTNFVNNGYVQDFLVNPSGIFGGNTIDFDTQVQYEAANGGVATSTWGQQDDYALMVTHRAITTSSASPYPFYYRVSYMGVTAPDDAASNSFGTDVPSTASDSPMAVDSTGSTAKQVYNVDYSLDFDLPSSTAPTIINQSQFQETPLPAADQGLSLAELIADSPPVQSTLDAPGSGGLTSWNTTVLTTVSNSPELRDHPVLDKFVTSMNHDPIALANYVLNEVSLSDATGYAPSAGQPNSSETIAITSVTSSVITTTTTHGLTAGQLITISGATGTIGSSLNGTFLVGTTPTTTTLTLNTVTGTPVTLSGTYGGSAVMTPSPASNIIIASVNNGTGVLTTTTPHNLHAGEMISINAATGTAATSLNSVFLVGSAPTATTLTLMTLGGGSTATFSGTYTADSGIINSSNQSINPQGVRRDALATFLEGQGSPTEQCTLLIYLLRKAGYPCGYVFPNQDQMLMIDQQLSSMLRMQIQGATWYSPSSTQNLIIPQLIPVNYPWVAVYINGQWVHIFPWLKNTVMQEGPTVWGYLPPGYQTGEQWLLHYAQNDPTIRQLTTPGGPYTDDVNVLFPLYVQQQLEGTALSIDQLGMTWYNQQVYYTRWQDFPRPWQTPVVTDANLAQNLDYTQNPAALAPALENIFDTISVQVFSDRTGSGVWASGDPVINTGALRLCDLHDRRFLLYHQVTSASGATYPTYNMILSLEPFNAGNSSTPNNSGPTYTFNGGSTSASGTLTTNLDPGDLMSQQISSVALATPTDDALIYNVTYNLHQQAQSIPSVNSLNQWNFFLGVSDTTTLADSRSLRKGDMACLCLDYGQVSQPMEEFEAEKYWNYQQAATLAVASSPSALANPELGEGQLLNIMGNCYYYKVSQLLQNTQQWTKTNMVTVLAHGLSKLSPLRDSNNNLVLVNNDLLLCYPRVDMLFNWTNFVGNSTDLLNSGDTGDTASDSASELVIGGGSAYEHLTINQFFQQNAAISTMKLLDLSQGWTPGSPTLVSGNGTYVSGGSVTSPVLTVMAATNASPSMITTSVAHGLQVGQTITISGATGNTAINGTFVVASVPSSSSFTLRNTGSGGVASNPGFGGTGQPLILTSNNYLTQGAVTSTIGALSQTLSQWCGGSAIPSTVAPTGSIWGQIQSGFTGTGTNISVAPMTTVYITPGPVTATAQGTQPVAGQTSRQYTGMGALSLGQGSYKALISSNLIVTGTNVYDNGGYAAIVSTPAPVISASDYQIIDQTLSGTPDSSFTVTDNLGNSTTYSIGNTTPSASYSFDTSSPTNFGILTLDLGTGNLVDTPQQLDGTQAYANAVYVTGAPTLTLFGATTAAVTLQMDSNGYIGATDYYGQMLPSNAGTSTGFSLSQSVYDPVNAVTGEFYVNALDLKLSGPMPLEIRRIYGSLNQASNNFGYGWRMSYFSYLMFSSDAVYNSSNTQVTTQPTLIYAAETDGSVMAYRNQSSGSSSYWIPVPKDNLNLVNVDQGSMGGASNPFNNRINLSTTTASGLTYSIYTLIGANGSVRTFQIQSFPTTSGSTIITMTRPYLQKWTDNRGNYYTFSYGTSSSSSSYGQVAQINSSNGDFVGFDYDVDGHIIEAFTGDGRFLYYQYDAFGDLTQVTLPDASSITYDYQHVMVPASTGTAVASNGTYVAHTAAVTSDNNIVISSASGSPCTLTTSTSNGLAVGDIVVINGAQGNTAINGTYTVGSTSGYSFTLLAGAAPATPDSTHLITEEIKPNGRILQNTYNPASNYASRQVVSQLATVGPNQSLVQNATFSYGAQTADTNDLGTFDGTNTITDVFGNVTTYKYTANQITEIDHPTQNTSNTNQPSSGPKTTQTWYYTTSGTGYQRSLATSEDQRQLLKAYQYDSNGNLLSMVLTGNLTGHSSTTETGTTTMTYNSTTAVSLPGGGSIVPNTLASVTDPIGNSTSYNYGDTVHPYAPTAITKATPSGTVSTATLHYGDLSRDGPSAFGLLEQEIVASGTGDAATIQYSYNENGFVTSKTEFTGTSDPNVVTSFTYDLRGEVTSQTDASGRSTRYTYDALGHRTGEERYDEWGNLMSWNFTEYNLDGDVEWVQGPRYSPNDYDYKQYDGAGRLGQDVKWLSAAQSGGGGVTAAGYATTTCVHDDFGNLTGEDDPNGNVIAMGYDAEGEMSSRAVSPPGGGASLSSESFTYEPGGLVSQHVDVLGGTENRTYTYPGQLKLDTMPDGTTESYLYDLTDRVVQETLTNGSYWTTAYNDYSRTITRTFYNVGGTQLAQESRSFDRRGNVISRTDVTSNVFTTTYDGLNRVKTVTGPSTSGSTAQQTTSYTYDAAGLKQTVANAAGEKTVTYLDALARPTLISVLNSGGTAVSNTGFWYSPDHQSVVETVGSGSGGVTTTTYTDTRGNVVLLQHADGTWQSTAYDANENKTSFTDEQGVTTSWTYNALNHPTGETLPGGAAVVNLAYNAAGELLTRAMPGAVTAKSVYDSAGRKTDEELDATGSVTRQYTYSYYSTGADKGLLQSVGDPRGGTVTTTYDDWLRPATINSTGATIAKQNQNTTYGYDIRGMVNSIVQGYGSSSTGPSTQVTRGYDAYGQLNAEAVYVNSTGTTTFTSGNIVSQWAQSWDDTGRRTALNWQVGSGAGSQYAYQYNASGLLTQVSNTGTYTYAYGDNNLLQSRTTPWLTETIATRDSRGRILTENAAQSGTATLSETMTYETNSQLASYTATGPLSLAGTTLNYGYDGRERNTTEPYLAGATSLQTENYNFDATVTGTLGSPSWTADNLGGIGLRTVQYRTTFDNIANTQNSYAQVTQDNFATSSGFDAAGNVTSRGGTALTWDAYNRLVQVGTGTSAWTAVYDGLGRRVQSTNGTGSTITYFYDPMVEFLELGHNNGGRTWNVYGPDKSGIYGGAQGIGGGEAVVTETGSVVSGVTNNYFGDAMNAPGSTSRWSAVVGGYGAMPGSAAVNANLQPQWRGKYIDPTGFYDLGARYYEPNSGRFLSADPLGNGSSMSLYDYAGGDPVNGLDPDGRVGKNEIEDKIGQYEGAGSFALDTVESLPGILYQGSIASLPEHLQQDWNFIQNPLGTLDQDFLKLTNSLDNLTQSVETRWDSGALGQGQIEGYAGAFTASLFTGVGEESTLAAAEGGTPQLFHIIDDFKGEPIGTPITYSPQELEQGTFQNLNYVVKENGELVIGKRFSDPDPGGHHPDLAGGGPVQAAGEVEFENGQITVLNNGSGHYLPSGPSARAAAENAFKNAGFNVPPDLYEDFGFK